MSATDEKPSENPLYLCEGSTQAKVPLFFNVRKEKAPKKVRALRGSTIEGRFNGWHYNYVGKSNLQAVKCDQNRPWALTMWAVFDQILNHHTNALQAKSEDRKLRGAPCYTSSTA